MSSIAKFGCLFSLFLVLGCNSAPPPPTEEKINELNSKMDEDMKNMMKQVPKTVPKK